MKLHIVVEDSLFGLGIVLAPVRTELTRTVDEPSATEEIGIVVEPVVVQRVGVERLPGMMEHDIVAGLHELLLTIVPRTLTGERDVVLRLTEMHMSHGTHGICGLIEIC